MSSVSLTIALLFPLTLLLPLSLAHLHASPPHRPDYLLGSDPSLLPPASLSLPSIPSSSSSSPSSSSPFRSISLTPDCAPNCTAALQAALAQCGPGPCRLDLAPGIYPVSVAPYAAIATVAAMRNLTIAGPAATLLLTDLNAGFVFSAVHTLSISGLSFDMARQPYTYGQALAANASAFVLRVNMSDYPFPPAYPWLLRVQSILQYDPALQRPAENGLDVYILSDPAPLLVDAASGTVTITHPSAAQVVPGQWYILRHQVYALNTFTLDRCVDVSLADLDIFSAPGMGLYAQLSSDVRLQRVRVAKRAGPNGGPPRPMSITADAVHCNACNGTLSIRDSLFDGQGDDGLNVHGKFGVVAGITSPTTLALQPETDKEHCGLLATAGDVVEFRDRNTFQPYATARLTGLSGLSATLDAVPAGVKQGDLLVSLSWMPSLESVNNTYRNNRARGQLIKTHNVLVANSTYDGCTGPAIQVFTDGCYWFESTAVHNWTVQNNVIHDVNYAMAALPGDVYVSACTPAHPNLDVGQVHSHVAIDGNSFFQRRGQPAVSVWAVDTLSISRNTVSFTDPAPEINFAASNSVNVAMEGNVCEGLAQCRTKQGA